LQGAGENSCKLHSLEALAEAARILLAARG